MEGDKAGATKRVAFADEGNVGIFDDAVELVRMLYLRAMVDTEFMIGWGDFLMYFDVKPFPSDSVLYDHEMSYSCECIHLNKTIPKIEDREFADFFEQHDNDDIWITSDDMNATYAPFYDFSLLRLINFSHKPYVDRASDKRAAGTKTRKPAERARLFEHPQGQLLGVFEVHASQRAGVASHSTVCEEAKRAKKTKQKAKRAIFVSS